MLYVPKRHAIGNDVVDVLRNAGAYNLYHWPVNNPLNDYGTAGMTLSQAAGASTYSRTVLKNSPRSRQNTLDATGRLTSATDPGFDHPVQSTVLAFVKLPDLVGALQIRGIFDCRPGATDAYRMYFYQSNSDGDTPYFAYELGGNASNQNFDLAALGFVDDEWGLYAVGWDGTNLNGYARCRQGRGTASHVPNTAGTGGTNTPFSDRLDIGQQNSANPLNGSIALFATFKTYKNADALDHIFRVGLL